MARARTTIGTGTVLLGLIAVGACSPDTGNMVQRPVTSPATGVGSPVLPTPGAGTAGAPAAPVTPPRAGTGGAATPTVPPATTPVVPPATTPRPSTGGSAPLPMNEIPSPRAGSGAAGAPVATAGAGAPTPTGPTAPAPSGAAGVPTIPAVKGDCPKFVNGTISFMGLGGIRVVAGAKGSGPTAPFVFYWHGTGSTSGEYASMASAVASGVTAEGGVLVSFQGTTGGDGLSGTSIFGKGDLDIGDQLIACAVRDHNVDPKRVYATGCSAGGLFSTNQAVLRSNYIAAAAPNSGGMTFPQTFQSMWTPALMTIHGAPGRDVVIIDFSNSSKTADDIFKKRNGFVINCNHGGGHCGGGGLAGDIWKFFKAHTYGVSPSPWKAALPSGFNSKCMIY